METGRLSNNDHAGKTKVHLIQPANRHKRRSSLSTVGKFGKGDHETPELVECHFNL